jgi:hypothetical protein
MIVSDLFESPLPDHWDHSMFSKGSTFRQRLKYALNQAMKLGTGSSRVVVSIDYEGRKTALKIARNRKGLLQNEIEASILSDRYAPSIVLPIIDYDTENDQPLWIHTEFATPATFADICRETKARDLHFLNEAADYFAGDHFTDYVMDGVNKYFKNNEEDKEIFLDWAQELAELATNFNVLLVDFLKPENWGFVDGELKVIDVGYTPTTREFYRNALARRIARRSRK